MSNSSVQQQQQRRRTRKTAAEQHTLLHPHTMTMLSMMFIFSLVVSEATCYNSRPLAFKHPMNHHNHHAVAAAPTEAPTTSQQRRKQPSSSETVTKRTKLCNNNSVRDDDPEDDRVVQSAFFDCSRERQLISLCESALLIRSKQPTGPDVAKLMSGSELDHMESMIQCSRNNSSKQQQQSGRSDDSELEHMESLLSMTTRQKSQGYRKAAFIQR